MNKPGVLLEHWRDQYDRLLRARTRLDAGFRSSLDYDDAFYHAAQDAWHLKDWIKNDQAVDESRRTLVADEVHKCDPLLIIADLANCTKHLVLENAKADAALASTHSTVGAGTLQRRILIRLKNGTERSATEVLDDAIRAWDSGRHRLLSRSIKRRRTRRTSCPQFGHRCPSEAECGSRSRSSSNGIAEARYAFCRQRGIALTATCTRVLCAFSWAASVDHLEIPLAAQFKLTYAAPPEEKRPHNGGNV